MTTSPSPIVRRADYREPGHWIESVDLTFELGEAETIVRSRLALVANERRGKNARPLVLHAEALDVRRVALDGREMASGEWRLEGETLVIGRVPRRSVLEIEVAIHPQLNTALAGLYRSGGTLCTQCEAEGFRRITPFLDRPDVMARFSTTIVAEKERYPILLSNGNRVEARDLEGGRHLVRWVDPFKKPSYLFALVAGVLVATRGTFVTRSGRTVQLEVWVEPRNAERCEHALRALQKAMRWDEERFGREYDLDVYMIVAVDDFNMGAMENKGLNVFNSKYVLASPATATDDDYEDIEGVIAHEYFHNWTGNRVTCRDWFQLTLKEGLTVYRDQEFSADTTSRSLQRIQDVQTLRVAQFPEDAGPFAHPVRPESYVEINNFYTATVYNKGAEVVRLCERLLGREGFRRGLDLYFERHDGQAVTCDDFRAALADANGVDLTQFARWYSTPGTPAIHARGAYDERARTYTLTLSQETHAAGKRLDAEPLHVPVAVGLIGPDGRDLAARVCELREREQDFVFTGIDQRPVPSILRGFSAPARLELERSDEELAFLMAHDSDAFNRWDAGQELGTHVLLVLARAQQAGLTLELDAGFARAFGRILADPALDGSLKAAALVLPPERVVAQRLDVIDPDALHGARRFAQVELARCHRRELEATYEAARAHGPYRLERPSIDRRRLCAAALAYLTKTAEPPAIELAWRQFEAADNMTDSISALACLVEVEVPERERALAAFHARWRHDPLVLDKWFALQAASSLPSTLARVQELSRHPDFNPRNPNRVRALIGTFGAANQVRFHQRDGAGYAFVAEQVLGIDALNPQVAARLVQPFNLWRRFDASRQGLMRRELERIAAVTTLSKDVREIVEKALGAPAPRP
jgi:aminopeptidase N